MTFKGDAIYLNNRDIAFFGGVFTCTNLIAGGAGAFMQTSGAADQRVEGGITVMSGKSLAFWLVSGGALEIAAESWYTVSRNQACVFSRCYFLSEPIWGKSSNEWPL